MKDNKNVIKDLDKPEEIVEEPIFIKRNLLIMKNKTQYSSY